MEEKKNLKVASVNKAEAKEKKVRNANEKLSYEQLEAYAQQITARAQEAFKENQVLKQALAKASMDNNFKEIECVLKCLDHADMFSPSFLDKVIARLEEVLTPQSEEEVSKETEENKEEEE